ncbi:MAG: 2-phosphosulfolactate phosphatase [Bacteroidota bacterium]|nr:2-phosphosulfolactate phosphatase [Bacteroidota bacterium]
MPQIETVYSPSLVEHYSLGGKTVVVVDILRATTSMCVAFAHGVQHIIPLVSIYETFLYKPQNYITAGERNGQKVEGFEKGNSPFDFMGDDIKDKPLAITTTNGTQAIHASLAAANIYIGAFVNLQTVADKLVAEAQDTIILCAGWKNKFNLEDTLFAGALAGLLYKNGFEMNDDASIAAHVLYNTAQSDLTSFIKKSAHAQRFERMGIDRDIDFCMQLDIYNFVPRFVDGKIVV